jgi:UDP-glucose 4-epimerase
VLALGKLGPGKKLTYNVGIGRGYSVREVIATVEEVTGLKVPVKEGQRRDGDPPELRASAEKIRAELGWAPKYANLKAIVETAWRWHRSHPTGFESA